MNMTNQSTVAKPVTIRKTRSKFAYLFDLADEKEARSAPWHNPRARASRSGRDLGKRSARTAILVPAPRTVRNAHQLSGARKAQRQV